MTFPPQFPLDKRGGALGKLGNVLAPRFADKHFERRFHQQRGQGLDTVMLVFWSVTAAFVLTMWGYHSTSKNGFDRPARIGFSLLHGNLLIGLVFWAVLRFLPRTRAHSSALLGLMTCMLVTLYTWGLPATARHTCQDVHNTFDSNLHQTVFTCIAFAAIFCGIGTSAFAAVCLTTIVNFITARSTWSELEQHGFATTFELPKLLALLFIIFAGVRRMDLYLRRDFAARELMLMVIDQQAREMEDALKAAEKMGREMDAPTLSTSASCTLSASTSVTVPPTSSEG